jgi:hypothetical protein
MNQELLTFLKNLTGALERGELCQRQLSKLGEFFLSYQFQEQVQKDIQTTEQDQNSTKEQEEYTRSEMIKFLSLGWYVYQVLLRGETLPTQVENLIDPMDPIEPVD